ncbi:hypothetical protein [Reichenbachiella sp.]|uniref:hypothetical protein n=1 Tax=Reichenbachiella sp. TaxID=2184521 RepID=UPI003298EB3F
MSDSNDFLNFLINEDIYVIDENDVTSTNLSGENEPEMVEEAEVRLNSLEKPKHEILVLFDNPSATNLSSDDLEYLGKILGSINLSKDHVEFLNVVGASAPITDGYKYVIAFTPNHQLSLDKSVQQYVAMNLGDTKVIIADALRNISTSTDLRKKLWTVLQEVFVN